MVVPATAACLLRSVEEVRWTGSGDPLSTPTSSPLCREPGVADLGLLRKSKKVNQWEIDDDDDDDAAGKKGRGALLLRRRRGRGAEVTRIFQIHVKSPPGHPCLKYLFLARCAGDAERDIQQNLQRLATRVLTAVKAATSSSTPIYFFISTLSYSFNFFTLLLFLRLHLFQLLLHIYSLLLLHIFLHL